MDEETILALLEGLPRGNSLVVPRVVGRPRAESWIPAGVSFQLVLSGQIPTTPWHTTEESILKRGDLICCAGGAASTRRYDVARQHLAFGINAGQLDVSLFQRAANDAPGFAHKQHWQRPAPRACLELGQLIDRSFKQGLDLESIKHLSLCFVPILKNELAKQQTSQFDKAMQWLREHACADLDRSDLAAYLHCHPDHVSRLFKQANGSSFAEERKRLRCERVCSLLANQSLSLADIATQCGFNSETYLIRSFKQIYGRTPGDWRRVSNYEH